MVLTWRGGCVGWGVPCYRARAYDISVCSVPLVWCGAEDGEMFLLCEWGWWVAECGTVSRDLSIYGIMESHSTRHVDINQRVDIPERYIIHV